MAEASSWIAIVDDDLSVLKALKRLLGTRDLRARTFGSAADFLAELSDPLPECLVLDLQMPGMSGLDLLQHLSRLGVDIPTIVITAHADRGVRDLCRSAGAASFLLKPLQDATLFAAIEQATATARSPATRPTK